jgi:hypothetical protein
LLYTGQTQTQPRSATEVDVRERKTMSRVDEMSRRVQQAMTLAMRVVAFGARYLLTADDLRPAFGPDADVWGVLGSPEDAQMEQQQRMQMLQAAMQSGMPPEQAEEQLGPERVVNFEVWLQEAERGIEAGSMRRIDHNAQVENLNVALNQLAPALISTPGGPLFVLGLAEEFARIHRFSPALQEAASKAAQITMQAMQAPPPPPGGAPPPGAPQ